jgi:CRP-like cAMP-binding protein
VQMPGQLEPLAVASYARGSYFGELGFLRNKPRNATVRALMACRCAAIEGDVFRVLVGEGTALRRRLLLESQTYVNSIC